MPAEPDPVELIAIARGLEDEGRYLAARLFRAAAASEGLRRSEDRPRSNEDLARAIEAIVPRLQAAEHDPATIGAMQRIARMLHAGEGRRHRAELWGIFIEGAHRPGPAGRGDR